MNSAERVVRDLFDRVWNGGDLAAIDELIADRYTIHSDPGDPWDGQTLDRDGFRNRFTISRSPFSDLSFEIHEVVADDSRVAVYWTMRGTNTGPLGDRPATNRTIEVPGMTIYYVADGKITGHTQALDRLTVLSQLGMLG